MAAYLGAHGSLVGVPHRHAVFIYPINDLKVVTVMQALAYAVHGMYTEGPGSISAKLYWYDGQKFTDIPYSFSETKIDFTPPDAFIEMLNELQEPQ